MQTLLVHLETHQDLIQKCEIYDHVRKNKFLLNVFVPLEPNLPPLM